MGLSETISISSSQCQLSMYTKIVYCKRTLSCGWKPMKDKLMKANKPINYSEMLYCIFKYNVNVLQYIVVT